MMPHTFPSSDSSSVTNPTHTLSLDQLQAYYPHRYENQLLDRATVSDPSSDSTRPEGQSQTIISQDDPYGRSLFFKTDGTLITSVYAEILALLSIASTGQLPDGVTAVFTGITQFKKTGNIRLGDPINGQVRQLSAKGPFLKYAGDITDVSGAPVLTCQVAAFYAKTQDFEAADTKKKVTVPADTCCYLVSASLFQKQPEMVCVDAIVHDVDSSLMTAYTYPTNHPLIKGHFPGNPIMMGIMQVMAIEDGAIALAHHRGLHDVDVTTSGAILKQDGTVVAEFKDAVIRILNSQSTPVESQTELHSLFKITFRDFVTPGTELRILFSDFSPVSDFSSSPIDTREGETHLG